MGRKHWETLNNLGKSPGEEDVNMRKYFGKPRLILIKFLIKIEAEGT